MLLLPVGDNTISEELQKDEPGNFSWKGYLKKGHFKFLLARGTWESLLPGHPAHEPILLDYYHDLSDNYQGDYRFEIAKDGEYQIFVNYNDGKYTLEVSSATDVTQDIYLLGDATPAGWNNNNPIRLDTDGGGFYYWEGYLNPGHFKFITKLGTWNSLVPVNAAHYDAISEMNFFSNIYKGDYRFVVKEGGNYKLTLFLRGKWFSLSKSTDLRSTISLTEGQAQSQFSLITDNNSVQVKVSGMPNVKRAQLVTITGRVVDMVQNVKGDFVLGSGLSAGVYVVNIVYDNNQVFTEKVNVR